MHDTLRQQQFYNQLLRLQHQQNSMAMVARPRQRRRLVLSCVECRKRKQKCDRGVPCIQCVARGSQDVCSYEKYRSIFSSLSNDSPTSPSKTAFPAESGNAGALLQHAQDYGYSNSESLNSMGMLSKVLADSDHLDISSLQPFSASQTQSKSRSEYFGYVRRLPPKRLCDKLFQHFFADVNPINSSLDQTIFGEQSQLWWDLAHSKLLSEGPDGIPEDIRCFPALIYQVLAVALQFLPHTHEAEIDELRWGPFQTIAELSKEYSDCGVSLAKIIGKAKQTLVGVQHSFLRDWWLVTTGNLLQAWFHSGETVKDAMAIGLHLEPEVPSSNLAEELLDILWMNELRKRTWLNLVVWDNAMALAQGRPMFIDLKDCTVTPPLDCIIPNDRLKRVPVGRSHFEKPTPITERVLRLQMTRRFSEIRNLELQGSIPRDPEKVKELHYFAIEFRKSIPDFYRTPDPDTSWDIECPFVSIHRELLCLLIDSFLMALHRPYIFTRERSQRQVYESALAILDSQERLFQITQESQSSFYIGFTFPTFDASILLAVVLVSNPERYQESFQRPYTSLKRALDRLEYIGSKFRLAKNGAVILQATLSRVLEAQEKAGFTPIAIEKLPKEYNKQGAGDSASASPLSDSEAWNFKVSTSAMDWMTQNDQLPKFDFPNLEVPMPLTELLLDEEMSILSKLAPTEDLQGMVQVEETIMEDDDNELWNFLAGYVK